MIATETSAPTKDRRHPLREELERAWPLVAMVPVLILVVWGAGILVLHSRVNDCDLRADRALAAHRVPWLNTATEWGTWLAETVPVIVILLAAIVIARRRTGNWRAPVFLAVVVGGEKLVYLVSSIIVARGRPPLPTLDDTYATSSFPSGHVGSAITLYAGIAIAVGAWRGRRYLYGLMAVMVVFASIVGFSRMYRGFHYPSDVAAGVFIGAFWTWFCVRILRPIKHE